VLVEHVGHLVDLHVSGCAVGPGENGAYGGRHQRFVALGMMRQQIPHEMDPAALLAGPGQGCAMAAVRLSGRGPRDCEETPAKRPVLRWHLARSQHSPVARLTGSDGDDQHFAHDAVIFAHLQVQGIQPDVRIDASQGALAERLDDFVQSLAGARDGVIVDPGQLQSAQKASTFWVLTPST